MTKISRMGVRAAVVAGVGSSIMSIAAAPAFALPVLAPSIGAPSIGTYNVAPICNPGPGVATNLNQITYTIYGTASAYSTNGSIAVATGITCWVKDLSTGVVYGTIAAGLPGPEAAVVGTVTVPFNSNPKLCALGNALFNNNATVTNRAPGC